MTLEQEELIVNNQKLIYKFLSNHNIYDEDLFQELLTHICSCIDKYDETKGAFSTWVFAVCNNKMHQIHTKDTRTQCIPYNMLTYLDSPINPYDESDGGTIADTVADDKSDYGFREVEAADMWERYADTYKEKFGKSFDKDMDIFKGIILQNITQKELAEKYHITRQAINLHFHRICRNLREIAKEDLKKQKVQMEQYVENHKQHKNYVPVSPSQQEKNIKKIVYKWIYLNIIPSYDSKFLKVIDIRDIINKELNLKLTTDETVNALAYCGFYPSVKRGDMTKYKISKLSPILHKVES